MHFRLLTSLLAIGALSPLAEAQIAYWAKKAGLEYFGAATDTPGFREREPYPESYPQYDAILRDNNNFDQTTPTNGQKWQFVEPSPGVFNFTEGDVVANLAARQGKLLRCHALVWHSQLAPWVEAGTWTPDQMREIIVRHIKGLMGYYKGKCHHWDVVNEVVSDDADGKMRPSVFWNVLGEEYIKLAFQTAAEVDPSAKLYMNDYAIERPTAIKTNTTKRLVKMLKDAGIRIDGVGLQAHLHADRPFTIQEHMETIKGFADLGVEVSYTELDVRIAMPVNETKLEWQKNEYVKVALACARSKACKGITLWDFYDPFSWIPHTFPDKGAATLFFEDFTKHPAYDGLVRAFKGYSQCKNKKRDVIKKLRIGA